MTRGVIACVVAVLAGPAAADGYRLANGLEVVLAPDPSAGSVVVHVWYRVGSDDGPAQVVERLLGHDSPHVDHARFAQTLDTLGGWDNATTAVDHTSLYEQLPPSALPLALFVEADRMFGAGEMMTAAKLERAGARSDRTDVAAAIHAALWPHAPASTSLDDVRAFWRDRFSPGNAVLVVAGAFDPAATRALIEHDFAWIASSPHTMAAATPAVPLDRSSTIAVPSETGAARVIVAARSDVPMSPAASDLEIAARVLAGGRSSRLYRRLVTTEQVASEVGMSIAPHRSGGDVAISVTARDPASAPAIAKAISEEIAGVVARGVTAAELARAKTRAIAELVTALEDLSFRAEILAAWTAYGGGDLAAARARIDRVTPESAQAAAKIWLAHTVTATVMP
jgi:zinc protease